MASRRKVTQDDLRRAMNEAKKKVATVAKRIESPLAKYTESGQLTCVLCRTTVRAEAIWPVHSNSKGHRERVEAAKRSTLDGEPSEEARPAKRRLSPSERLSSDKRVRGVPKNSRGPKTASDLPGDFFDDSTKRPSGEPSGAANAWEKSERSEIPRAERAQPGGTGEKEALDAREEANVASLPEGFFDDPRMDARVRNVDYKDPIEEEWDKFQREIKEEAAQSAQIIADDQEEATTVRQLDEIEEQMRNWTRVMDFVKLREKFRASERVSDSVGENESCDDGDDDDDGGGGGGDGDGDGDADGENNDEDYDEFLDWRAKNSYGG